MAYERITLELEPGEELVQAFDYQPGTDAEPYAFAVSKKAIFVAVKKRGFVLANPWYFRRLPLPVVRSVSLRPVRPIGTAALGLFLLACGLIATGYLIATGGLRQLVESPYGPVTAIAAGAYLLYAARGQQAIVLDTLEGPVTLAPPSSISAPKKHELRALQEGFIAACRKVGVHVA